MTTAPDGHKQSAVLRSELQQLAWNNRSTPKHFLDFNNRAGTYVSRVRQRDDQWSARRIVAVSRLRPSGAVPGAQNVNPPPARHESRPSHRRAANSSRAGPDDGLDDGEPSPQHNRRGELRHVSLVIGDWLGGHSSDRGVVE